MKTADELEAHLARLANEGPIKRFFRHGLYLKRFQYWWPWACTFWYRPWFERGCDEFHNSSWMIGLGPLGALIFLKPFGKMRDENSPACEECKRSEDAYLVCDWH